MTNSPAPRHEDVDLVSQLIGHRLRQDDIRRILQQLSDADREAFTERLADILRKTSALLQVSRRMADSLSLEVLLPRMVELVSDFLEAERCTIFLHDHETDELYTKAAVGISGEIRFPAGAGIAGAVFRSGLPVNIPDAYADPRFNQEIDKQTGFHTRNILCAPIVHSSDDGARTIGVAQVLNKKGEDAFDPEDLSLLETLTGHAASAFVNAQLHAQIARARAEETQLLEVTAAMSSELQLQPLLKKIMETVATILEADRATLFVHDAKTNELWALVSRDEGLSQIRFPSHMGIAGAVFTTGQTINIPDAYADSRFNPEVDRKTGYRTRSILCMPVVNRKGVTIAVTQVLNRRGGPFTTLDERRLKAFSSQAAIAMENAQLFDEIIRVRNYNESILESMSNGVVTLDPAGMIVKVNRAALDLLRRDDAADMVGKSDREFFAGRNTWVADTIEAVLRSGSPEVAMDTDLWLSENAAADERKDVASVNLTIVPLGDPGEQNQGCMVMFDDITNEKRLKGTMARYMSKEVADRLLSEGESALGGKLTKASVLFTDIRDFTSISERIGPQDTVKMLNEYFSLMVDILLEKGGILDKYIGDAIMAVFGAPFSGPEDADHAVQAAIGMLRSLHALNERRVADGQAPLLMGLGINTDQVLSGNIGSLKRMDYTVIGDGVNLASRLESANKHYHTQILISEFTRAELRQTYLLREVDRMRVKGKSQPVGVYEVLDHLPPERQPNVRALLDVYGMGLDLYRRRDWGGAQAAFEEALDVAAGDGPSKLYLERCSWFLEHPPADDWDGVWTMKEK
ncbi:MAG: GAF domain-containing protein [Vicinamibacteria bacterium]|nr:GAF domain-containing protein [Vicinamibacteria bacterium]